MKSITRDNFLKLASAVYTGVDYVPTGATKSVAHKENMSKTRPHHIMLATDGEIKLTLDCREVDEIRGCHLLIDTQHEPMLYVYVANRAKLRFPVEVCRAADNKIYSLSAWVYFYSPTKMR